MPEFGIVFRVFDGLHRIEWHRLRNDERHFRVGVRKNSELLKSHLDCQRQSSDFALIHLGGGVQNDKKREQQSNEVGIGHQPTLVIRLWRLLFADQEELSLEGVWAALSES